jgi:hypothetical protein
LAESTVPRIPGDCCGAAAEGFDGAGARCEAACPLRACGAVLGAGCALGGGGAAGETAERRTGSRKIVLAEARAEVRANCMANSTVGCCKHLAFRFHGRKNQVQNSARPAEMEAAVAHRKRREA